MIAKLLLPISLLLLGAVARARNLATYDQRQEGKVNVQIDVKDVQILALVDSEMLDDYTSYDYAYDYADFTIKPGSRPTTPKPSSNSTSSSSSSSSNETWSIWPTNPTQAPDASSTPAESEALPATIAVALVHHEPLIDDENKKIVEGVSNASKLEAEKQQLSTSTASAVTVEPADDAKPNDSNKRPLGIAEPRKRCPVGFLLKSGKCFKRRYSLISPRLALMKLAPTLLSKSNILSGIPAAAAAAAAITAEPVSP